MNSSIKNDVLTMLEQIHKGEDPIILKICTGRATKVEKSDWGKSNNIPSDKLDEVVSMMKTSFSKGPDMITNNNIDIMETLDNINTQLKILNTNLIEMMHLLKTKLPNL